MTRYKFPRFDKNPRGKLTEADVVSILSMLREDRKPSIIAKIFGVTRQRVQQLRKRL